MIKWYARWTIDDAGTLQDFKIIESNIKDSIRETTYSYITIDFNASTTDKIPLQFSKIQIISVDDALTETLEFVGHLDSIKYPEFSTTEKPLHLELSIMNLRGILTKKAIIEKIDNLPLTDALIQVWNYSATRMGFRTLTSADIDVKNYRVSEIFVNESIEKVMNFLANKFNFIWLIQYNNDNVLIDQTAIVSDIDYYFANAIVKTIDDTNCFISQAVPSYTTVDYANVLNIKNMILITHSTLLPVGTSLVSGTSYMFTNPFSISENTCFRLTKLDPEGELDETYAFVLNTNIDLYTIIVNMTDKTITYSTEIGFDGIDNDDATKKILLITDATDTTKVLGFKWKGATEIVAVAALPANSYSSLVPYQTQYIDPNEVNKMRNRTQTNGFVEKIINANEKYFTIDEVQEYAVSLFGQNNLQTSEIAITLKGLNTDTIDYNIGDVVYVNLPDIQTTNTFLITDISKELGTEIKNITINARSKNVNENSMDIYRNELQQENEDKLTRKLVAFYNQDEKTLLSKEIYVNGVRVDV